jgi:hypothetical protein
VKRYKVTTCTGWAITSGGGTRSQPIGLTASVLDTLNAHREVKRFRSEDKRYMKRGFRLGHEGAIKSAQEYADKLNAECGHT